MLAGCAIAVSVAADAQTVEGTPPPPPVTPTIHEEVVQPAPDVADPAPSPNAPVVTPATAPAKPRHAPAIDLSTLETKDLSLLYFDPGQTYLTPYVARSFENAIQLHEKMFNWKPWDRTTALLKDFSDYGNAAARSSPNNAILLDVAPLSLSFETFSPGERFFTLTNHELAHVATMDVWNTHDAGWRKFLHGKPMPVQEHPESILYNYLATPRVNVPRWWLEGSAVFMETWMAGGLGRGQGAFDEMVFRAKVRDNARLYSPLGLESEGTSVDFQVGVNDYLYGTRFFSYLALTYSPAKVIEWLRRDEGSTGYYSAAFRKIYGKSLDSVWGDWITWEHGFQTKNLAALAKYPLTPIEHLVPHGLGSVSRTFYDAKTNSLIGAFRYPGVIGFVGSLSLDTGKIRKLGEIKGMMLYRVTSIAFDPAARKVFYTEDNYALRDIVEVDVDTGKRRMLLRDARIGDLVVNAADKSIWGIRHQNGFATLVRIPMPHQGFNQVHTFAYGTTPFDLDISPDGTMISASVGEINGEQSVRVWRTADLLAGQPPSDVAKLVLAPSTPEGFVFTPDGKALYGSAYYTGVSNIFRFDIASGKSEAVSNSSTGLFRPIPMADGTLIVDEYTGEGLTPSRMTPKPLDDLGTVVFLGTEIARQRAEVKTWGVGSPSRIDLDALVTERGHYVPSKALKLDAAYPIIEGYKGDVTFGYHLNFEDPLQFRQFKATISVSPYNQMKALERLHIDLELKLLDWRFRYWHNDADFYDLFGPVERSRKGDAFILNYKKAKIYDPPRQLDVFGTAAAYFGLDQLPTAQNVPSNFRTLLSTELGARYTNTTKSLGAVDHEKGIGWEVVADADYAKSNVYPRIHAGFDAGVPLPIHNSSVWIYTSAGVAGGKALSPLGSFYFGSFRNNYVDDREVKRYRELESFPGFDIDGIDARTFGKAMAEWNLPPVRFAEVGTPSLFLSSARTALFAGILAADRASGGSQTYQSIGGQVDFNFTVALRLPMTLSFGAASGFRDGHYRRTELLASLKIL
ncbi:hypothetical protein KX816_11670 [Sphingosinicellaceae bacterium]|nr:hypothetical protein KX816_11670 [Sphingosinicellaceae bacterium]